MEEVEFVDIDSTDSSSLEDNEEKVLDLVSDEEENSDSKESSCAPVAKKVKIELDDFTEIVETKTQRCRLCKQVLDDNTPRVTKLDDFVSEEEAVKSLHIGDEDEKPQIYLHDYSIYDRNGHLIPLDTGLIEKKVQILFLGTLKSPFDDGTPGVYVQDVVISQWWLTGTYSNF